MTAKLHPVLTEVVGPQVLFDYVIAHIRSQGRASVALESAGPFSKGKCLYRSDALSDKSSSPDCSCAVGCLLTDDEAKHLDHPFSDDAGTGVISLEMHGLLPERLLDHVNLLDDLQVAHDHSAFEEDDSGGKVRTPESFLQSFVCKAEEIARKHNLTMPI